jgi:hypothetical protein
LEAVALDPALAETVLLPTAARHAAAAPPPSHAPASRARQGAPATRPLPAAADAAATAPLHLPVPAVQGEPPAARWWERPRQALRDLGEAVSARLPGGHLTGRNAAPHGDEPHADAGNAPASAPPVAAPEPSAEVLTAAYEAIREGRINDPTTVRHVADAFTRLAKSEQPAGTLDFDPERAAQLLLQRAQMLDDPTRPPAGAPDERPTPRAPQSPPRDDNVIRGG